MKEHIKKYLAKKSVKVIDFGPKNYNKNDDYPDVSFKVAKKIASDKKDNLTGILICGSGAGVSIVANKVKGVRAILVFNKKLAIQAREHEDANIAALPSDWITKKTSEDIVDAWLGTKFSGEKRHERRLKKIKLAERKFFK